MKRLVSAILVFYSCAGYGQTQTSNNLLGSPTTSNNILYNAGQNSYQYSYQTGQVTASGLLPQYDPLQILTLSWSFDALMNCNNSIGGYCGDPDGKEDELSAFLEVDNSQGDVDARNVFSTQGYSTEWQTFSGSETYDFSSAYENVNFRIEGKDRGYWAGHYGPKVRNPSVVAIYTPINTGATIVSTCSTSQNDLSCGNYENNITVEQPVIIFQEPEPQPPTFGEQATNVVFGDSPDDFLYLDQPDSTGKPKIIKHLQSQQAHQNMLQETEMFKLPLEQDMPRINDEPFVPKDSVPVPEVTQITEIKKEPVWVPETRKMRFAEPEEIIAEVARVTKEPRPPVARVQEAVKPEPVFAERRVVPVGVVAETRTQPIEEAINTVVRPTVDVVGIALSLVNQQTDQTKRALNNPQQYQTMQQMNQSESKVNMGQAEKINYWDFTTKQTQVLQTLAQQTQQQANTTTSVDSAPPAQAQFEDDFNDAIATGQSVGQFLSAQPPDFSRFDVDEPSIQEQKLVKKATVAIKTMSEVQVEKSMDKQLETLSDTGGFTDQSITVFLISSNPSFNQYQDVNLSDREEFYKSTQVYPKNIPRVDPLGVLRLGGSETFNNLVDIQWQR